MRPNEALEAATARRGRALALLTQAYYQSSVQTPGRLDEAEAQLRIAIMILDAGFVVARDREVDEDKDIVQAIAREFSLTHGMLGDVLRRRGRIIETLEVANARRTRARALLSQVSDYQSSDQSSGRLVEAEAQLRAVIMILNAGFVVARDREVDEDKDIVQAIARELSDAHGMLGGVLRRQGRLDGAIEQYKKGRAYEDEQYGVVGSYNLTNWLTLSLCRNPGAYEEKRHDLLRAVRQVQRQAYGRRRNQWWAWADLGLLHLLTDSAAKAQEAYDQFRCAGAGPREYQSTLSFLEQCRDQLLPIRPVAERLQTQIERLRNTTPA